MHTTSLKLQITISRLPIPGSNTVYAKLDYSEGWGGGTSNPPIPDDGNYHKVKAIAAGQTFNGPLFSSDLTISTAGGDNGMWATGAGWGIGEVVGVAEIRTRRPMTL